MFHQRMIFAIIVVLTLVRSVSAQNAPAAPEKSSQETPAIYQIELKILEHKSTNEALAEDKLPHGNAEAIPQDLPTAKAETPDADHSAAEKTTGAELWEAASREPGVTVLAAPRLLVNPQKRAAISIQTKQVFTYLVPLGNGKFQAKQTAAQELGMNFTMQVQPSEGEPDFIDVTPLEVNVTSLDGREPVPGLDLDVGKPIVATRSLKSSAKLKLGEARAFEIPSGPKTQAVLLMRVSRPSTTAEK